MHHSPVPLVLIWLLTKWPLSLSRDERKHRAVFPEVSDQIVGRPSQIIRLFALALLTV